MKNTEYRNRESEGWSYPSACLLVFFLVMTSSLMPTNAYGEEADALEDRWVFVQSVRGDLVEELKAVIDTAADNGLNGMLMQSGFDAIERRSPEDLASLLEVINYGRERGIEPVPLGFQTGWSGAIRAHNPNLSVGHVAKSVYRVDGNLARLVPDATVSVENGGFEVVDGNRVDGLDLQDDPGAVSFVDTEVFHSGKTSLRFENLGKTNARIRKAVRIRPLRQYRISFWIKTEGVERTRGLRVRVTSGGRNMVPVEFRVRETMDWEEVAFGFNSLDRSEIDIALGMWVRRRRGSTAPPEAIAGRFWVDDLKIEDVGPVNVLRRPGTPVTIRGAISGMVYEEGVDYEPLIDPELAPTEIDHSAPELVLTPDSRARTANEDLTVTYYHPVRMLGGQVAVCMSEPELYDIWDRQVGLIEKHISPRKYALSIDEIRAGGSCRACKSRGISMAEILGDATRKAMALVRKHNPDAEIYALSDMYDPFHNARDTYYLVEGDYTGAADFIPTDLHMICWYYRRRVESLKFFSDRGHQTVAGAYYDGDDMQNVEGWLESMKDLPGARGVMYTTWERKYGLLGDFGRLVGGPGSGAVKNTD